MAIRGRQRSTIALAGGIIAGIFGGIVLSLYALLATVARGHDPWTAFKMAAAPFFPERALEPGFDASVVVVGILVHFAVSVGWGAIFGVLAYGASLIRTLIFGAVYGALVWLVMYSAVLPILGLGQLARSTSVGPALLQHVMFGLALAVGFLPFQRRV